jgi:hypothetical protein
MIPNPQRELESLKLKVAMLEARLKYLEAVHEYEMQQWKACAEYWRELAEGKNGELRR